MATKNITFTIEDLNRMNSPASIAELLKEKIDKDSNKDYYEFESEPGPEPEPEPEPEEEVKKEKTYDPKNPRIELGQPTPKKGKYPIKWVVGNHYKLRFKGKAGIRGYEKTYVLKKFIYTIKQDVVNVVIMKQVSGPQSAIFTLPKSSCVHYHIKYEPGLQVMAMDLNWIPC